jgi:hypothetical protein
LEESGRTLFTSQKVIAFVILYVNKNFVGRYGIIFSQQT